MFLSSNRSSHLTISDEYPARQLHRYQPQPVCTSSTSANTSTSTGTSTRKFEYLQIHACKFRIIRRNFRSRSSSNLSSDLDPSYFAPHVTRCESRCRIAVLSNPRSYFSRGAHRSRFFMSYARIHHHNSLVELIDLDCSCRTLDGRTPYLLS